MKDVVIVCRVDNFIDNLTRTNVYNLIKQKNNDLEVLLNEDVVDTISLTIKGTINYNRYLTISAYLSGVCDCLNFVS